MSTTSAPSRHMAQLVARTMARVLLFALIAVALLATLLVLTGHAPWPALSALASGAVGSGFAISSTIVRAIPLALSGLAVAVAFRAGLLNIGAEGQLLIGACVATATGAFVLDAPRFVALPTSRCTYEGHCRAGRPRSNGLFRTAVVRAYFACFAL